MTASPGSRISKPFSLPSCSDLGVGPVLEPAPWVRERCRGRHGQVHPRLACHTGSPSEPVGSRRGSETKATPRNRSTSLGTRASNGVTTGRRACQAEPLVFLEAHEVKFEDSAGDKTSAPSAANSRGAILARYSREFMAISPEHLALDVATKVSRNDFI